MIHNDAIILGILFVILAGVFYTSHLPGPRWKRFYTFVPSLLLCYFIPSLLTSIGLWNPEKSNLYHVASRFLLPTSLVFLTLSVDLKGIGRLGPKLIIMFLAGTTGVVLGGPVALLIVAKLAPHVTASADGVELWKGMATLAGSWIGGGANQVAMKEIFQVDDQLFSAMISVDVIVANIWMAFLLYGAARSEPIDAKIKADTNAISNLIQKMSELEKRMVKIPSTADLMVLMGVGFGALALSHASADAIAPRIEAHAPALARFSLTAKFFWIVVIATTLGVIFSFTPLKKLEGMGASKIGSVFLYILVATIGMKMDVTAIFRNPGLFAVGGVWMLIHISVLLVTAKAIRAPVLFIAVGSQANIGGAASAPIVASAVHPKLAPVGVLLAVLGYALGTYAAWVCAQLMRVISGE